MITLMFVFVNVFMLVAQSSSVKIQLKLYPVQILEVNAPEELPDVHTNRDRMDRFLPIDPLDYLSAYSTSHFVLKINRIPEDLIRPEAQRVPDDEQEARDERDVSPIPHVLYSMEAL